MVTSKRISEQQWQVSQASQCYEQGVKDGRRQAEDAQATARFDRFLVVVMFSFGSGWLWCWILTKLFS